MSTTGEHSTQETGAAGPPATPPPATVILLRSALGLTGALSLVGGLTWVLLNMHGPHPAVDLLVGGVLSAGGLVLLMPHRFNLPGLAGAAGAAGVAVLGTVAGLAVKTTQLCCEFAYAESRGFPWPLIQRGAEATTPETARNLALAAQWHPDAISVAAGLLFWAHAGLLLTATAVLAHRAWSTRHPHN